MTDQDFTRSRTDKFMDANVSIVEFESRHVVGANFFAEVNLTQIERMRDASRASGARRPPYTAFVVKAVAKALAEHPYANARIFPRIPFLPLGRILVRFRRRDVAVAAERSGEGMEAVAFCDILRSADERPLDEVSGWLKELAEADLENNRQWREFSQTVQRFPRWLSALLIRMPCFIPSLWIRYRGAAALVSSPAKYGVDVVGATWVWPLGVSFGLVRQRPVVRDARIVACPSFTLTLSFDRRMLAGAQTARLFRRMVDILESAETELA